MCCHPFGTDVDLDHSGGSLDKAMPVGVSIVAAIEETVVIFMVVGSDSGLFPIGIFVSCWGKGLKTGFIDLFKGLRLPSRF